MIILSSKHIEEIFPKHDLFFRDNYLIMLCGLISKIIFEIARKISGISLNP